MKRKNGFTLIELLAVIVLLAIVGGVGITALMNNRKQANIKLSKSMEKTIATVGENIYSKEYLTGRKDPGYFYPVYNSLDYEKAMKIGLDQMKAKGYIKTKELSNGCEGFLIVLKTYDGPEFTGYVKCPYYTSDNYGNASSIGTTALLSD